MKAKMKFEVGERRKPKLTKKMKRCQKKEEERNERSEEDEAESEVDRNKKCKVNEKS